MSLIYDCPHAEVCRTCPCSHEDDACFPGERLRAERDRADSAAAIFSDAASEWKRRAEEAEAVAERWKSQHERCVAHMTHDRQRMRKAEAEVERLREALRHIRGAVALSDPIHREYALVKRLERIASEALSSECSGGQS